MKVFSTAILRPLRAASAAVATSCFLAIALTAPASADVIIVGSDASGLRPGSALADAQTLSVPAGKRVRVMLPSGRTIVVAGPRSVVVRDLSKGEPRNDTLLQQVEQMLRTSDAGRRERPGATRSIGNSMRTATARPAAFSWHEVPIDAEGDYCVERGAALKLARSSTSGAMRVTIVDVSATKRAETSFKSGEDTAAWPGQMPPKVGSFALLVAGQPMRQVRLRMLSPLPDKESMLRVLHGQRCQTQMQALLKLMQDPNY